MEFRCWKRFFWKSATPAKRDRKSTRLNSSHSQISYAVFCLKKKNAYTLTFGGLLLLGGRAGDILGRPRVFAAGIAVFTVASLASGLSQSAGSLSAALAAPPV